MSSQGVGTNVEFNKPINSYFNRACNLRDFIPACGKNPSADQFADGTIVVPAHKQPFGVWDGHINKLDNQPADFYNLTYRPLALPIACSKNRPADF